MPTDPLRGPRGFQGDRGPTGLTGPQGPQGAAEDPLTEADVKTLYESNPDTNSYPDADQAKVQHLSVTQDVDLDATEQKASGALQKNQNLSDINDTEAARGNLGLGIYIPDSLRKSVETATGGRITVLYDDLGQPSYMHVFPRNTYENLGYATELGSGTLSAFDVGSGSFRSEVFIGVYPAVMRNNRACSLPSKDPEVNINFDDARAACTAKGAGWHLYNRHEHAAVAFWCMINGFEPRGNTNDGSAHDAPHEVGITQGGGIPGGGGNRTLVGSGPLTWRHTGDPTGIADLVGNTWEWQDMLKLVDGQINCTPHNDPTIAESAWDALGHYFSDDGSSPILQNSPGNTTTDNVSINPWSGLAKASGYTESQLLNRLLVSPASIAPQGRFYCRTQGERLPLAGGNWSSGGSAGLAALHCSDERSSTYNSIGFRPAFVS